MRLRHPLTFFQNRANGLTASSAGKGGPSLTIPVGFEGSDGYLIKEGGAWFGWCRHIYQYCMLKPRAGLERVGEGELGGRLQNGNLIVVDGGRSSVKFHDGEGVVVEVARR